jgi:hypothetical protein
MVQVAVRRVDAIRVSGCVLPYERSSRRQVLSPPETRRRWTMTNRDGYDDVGSHPTPARRDS